VNLSIDSRETGDGRMRDEPLHALVKRLRRIPRRYRASQTALAALFGEVYALRKRGERATPDFLAKLRKEIELAEQNVGRANLLPIGDTDDSDDDGDVVGSLMREAGKHSTYM
jgi:hypothetical protein